MVKSGIKKAEFRFQADENQVCFNTGDCLIEVTTRAGLTVLL